MEEKRKNTTSNAVKQRWNAKNYEQFKLELPIGLRDEFRAACDSNKRSMRDVAIELFKNYVETERNRLD